MPTVRLGSTKFNRFMQEARRSGLCPRCGGPTDGKLHCDACRQEAHERKKKLSLNPRPRKRKKKTPRPKWRKVRRIKRKVIKVQHYHLRPKLKPVLMVVPPKPEKVSPKIEYELQGDDHARYLEMRAKRERQEQERLDGYNKNYKYTTDAVMGRPGIGY